MRKDMQRVIINTGRYGGGYSRKARNRGFRDLEEAPNKESMRAEHLRGWRKYQGDRLQPLIRFLEKNVGKLWNDVWSEICEHNSLSGVIGRHVRTHTEQWVDSRDMRDIHQGGGWFHGGWGFYVDDKGFLREYPKESKASRMARWASNNPPEYVQIDGHFFKKEKGVWYRYEQYEVEHKELDPLQMLLQKTKVEIYRTRITKHYRKVKQLNKKELRNLGLKNKAA